MEMLSIDLIPNGCGRKERGGGGGGGKSEREVDRER